MTTKQQRALRRHLRACERAGFEVRPLNPVSQPPAAGSVPVCNRCGRSNGTHVPHCPNIQPPGPCAFPGCGHPFTPHFTVSGNCAQCHSTPHTYLDPATCSPKPDTLPEPDATLLPPSRDTTLAACDWWFANGDWWVNRDNVTAQCPVWRARRKAVSPQAELDETCTDCGRHKSEHCADGTLKSNGVEIGHCRGYSHKINPDEPPALPPRPADLSVLVGYQLGDVLTDCREKSEMEWAVSYPALYLFTGPITSNHPDYGRRRWIVQRNPRPVVDGWEFPRFVVPKLGEPCWLFGQITYAGEGHTAPVWIAVRKPAPMLAVTLEQAVGLCVLSALGETLGMSDDRLLRAYLAQRKGGAPCPK